MVGVGRCVDSHYVVVLIPSQDSGDLERSVCQGQYVVVDLAHVHVVTVFTVQDGQSGQGCGTVSGKYRVEYRFGPAVALPFNVELESISEVYTKRTNIKIVPSNQTQAIEPSPD